MAVLSCLPKSICSWNYSITDSASEVTASVRFNFLDEQGNISLGSNYYGIEHTWLGGKWSLTIGDRVVAVAVKPNPLTRYFEVSYDSQNLILRAESLFTRSFLIEQNGRLLGRIQPKHLFTKRASIDCSSSVPIHIQVFLFWLTVLMWKRAANKSKAASTTRRDW
jgi:hypothetical protein